MKEKCRIVERTNIDGSLTYVIQTRHLILRWLWQDGSLSSFRPYTYECLEDAQKNLCYFDGTRNKDRVIN